MTPNDSEPDFAALVALAEARFFAWHQKEVRPERLRRLDNLIKQSVSIGALRYAGVQECQEYLGRVVREQISVYRAVAYEYRSSEMLSTVRLNEFKGHVMLWVRAAIADLKDRIVRHARRVGVLSENALGNGDEYIILHSVVQDIVDAELGILRAEGRVLYGSTHAVAGKTGYPARSKSRRGPTPDVETARRVAKIVHQVANGANGLTWKERLPEICESLDENRIPCPKTWKKRSPPLQDWSDAAALERELVIKAIEYRLKKSPKDN